MTIAGILLTVVNLNVVLSPSLPIVIGSPDASVVPWRTKSPLDARVKARGEVGDGRFGPKSRVVVVPRAISVRDFDVTILSVTGPSSPVMVTGELGARVFPLITYWVMLFLLMAFSVEGERCGSPDCEDSLTNVPGDSFGVGLISVALPAVRCLESFWVSIPSVVLVTIEVAVGLPPASVLRATVGCCGCGADRLSGLEAWVSAGALGLSWLVIGLGVWLGSPLSTDWIALNTVSTECLGSVREDSEL